MKALCCIEPVKGTTNCQSLLCPLYEAPVERESTTNTKETEMEETKCKGSYSKGSYQTTVPSVHLENMKSMDKHGILYTFSFVLQR